MDGWERLEAYEREHGSVEHCGDCGEDFDDAPTEDLCPSCGARWCMTTLYGPHRVRGYVIECCLCWNCEATPNEDGDCDVCGFEDVVLRPARQRAQSPSTPTKGEEGGE